MLPYSLANYDLILPVDKDGGTTGTALDIPAGKTNPLSEKFLVVSPSSYAFICPDGGATTDPHDPNARVELHNTKQWTIKDHAVDTPFNVAVTQLDEGAKTVICQIHDQKEPMVKVVWSQAAAGSSVDARVKLKDGASDTTVNLLKGMKLGDVMNIQLEFVPKKFLGMISAKIVVTINGEAKKISVKYSGSGGTFKFCRGNYRFTTGKKGNVGIVVHS